MPKDKLEFYKKQHDPVDIARKYLREKAGEDEVKAIEEEVQKEMEKAVAFAQSSPEPDLQEFLAEVAQKYN